MPKIIKKHGKTALVFGLILVLIGLYFLIPDTQAGLVTTYKDTLSDSRPSTVSNHTIQFTTATTVHTGDTITVTFAAGFDLATNSVDYTDIDMTDDAAELTLAAVPGSGGGSALGAAIAGQVLTITENDTDTIVAGSAIIIEIGTNATGGAANARIINSTAGVKDISIAGDFGDTGTIKVAILSGVSVTATVAETLSFTIDETTLDFGAIDGTNIRYTTGGASSGGSNSEPANDDPAKITISTNASGGATITIQDVGDDGGNAGLYRSVAPTSTILATTPTAVSGTTASYAPYGKNASSSVAIAAGFQTGGGTAVTTSAQTFITAAGPLSTNNTADLVGKAGIAATTPTGAYADTLILIATPTF